MEILELIYQFFVILFFAVIYFDTLRKGRNIKKWVITILLMMTYCWIWKVVEYILNGRIVDKVEDNIMICLLLPVFYITAGYIHGRFAAYLENRSPKNENRRYQRR